MPCRPEAPVWPAEEPTPHVWRKDDVLIIDDRATMHRAHGDYDPDTLLAGPEVALGVGEQALEA